MCVIATSLYYGWLFNKKPMAASFLLNAKKSRHMCKAEVSHSVSIPRYQRFSEALQHVFTSSAA